MDTLAQQRDLKRIQRLNELGQAHAYYLLDNPGCEGREAILGTLHDINIERESLRNAIALRKYRAGEPVASWPQQAPYRGF